MDLTAVNKVGHIDQGAAAVDWAPHGKRLPGLLDRTILAITGSLPASWLGLRLAALFRRIVTRRLGTGGLDVERWGLRLRLYPGHNGCEKNLLFTPQMYDTLERRLLADAADAALARYGAFVFVDVGANVGLYSLYLAARVGERARILAIEPQPGIVDRLAFSLKMNPSLRIEVLREAASDRTGEAALVINRRDGGGTHLRMDGDAGREVVRVPCRPLIDMLRASGIDRVDALKIDVEGAEDLVLGPFLREAPVKLLPDLVVIEDTRDRWRTDVFALLAGRGYQEVARARKHNVVLGRGGAATEPAL